MDESFDPIIFLNLTHLSPERQEMFRPEIYKDMTLFLVQKFLGERRPEEIDEIEKKLPEIKDFESAVSLILSFDPSFEQKRENWLNEYKLNFKLENISGI